MATSRRNQRRTAKRFDRIDPKSRARVVYLSALFGAVCLLGAVFVLSKITYLVGMSPNNEVYRTGTVTITSCTPWKGHWGMSQCVGTNAHWNPEVRPGATLTQNPTVAVVSGHPLAGTQAVCSRLDALAGSDAQGEVIMPLDQPPAGYGVKVLIVLACVAVAFVATFLAAQVAWRVALRRSQRSRS